MKSLQFLIENLPFLTFVENFIKFSQKFGQKIRKFSKYAFVGGSGVESPEASEFIKNLLEKSMETSNFWNFALIMREFFLIKMLILIKIKERMMVSRKSLIILKEI